MVSATTSSPRGAPSQPTKTGSTAGRFGGVADGEQVGVEVLRPVGEEPFAADDDGVSVHDALHAESLGVRERLDGREDGTTLACAGCDRSGDRVLGRVLQRAGEAEYVFDGGAVGSDDVDERHLAGGDGAGLVEHDRVDSLGRLEHLGTLDEDPELCASTGADHERGGCGETERARAGDDQHGDGGGERSGGAVGRRGDEPESERRHGEGDDDGHEDARDPVGESLDLCLAGLGVLDQAGDLGERSVGPDPGGAHDEAAAGVDGGAGDGVAGADFDRNRFAGEQRGVDGRGALDDDAVGGDLLAGSDDEQVVDGELLDGDAGLDTVAEHGDVLGAEFEQCAQRGTGSALGACLEVATGEDEHGDAGGDLEVDLARAHASLGGEREAVAHSDHAGVAEEQGVQATSRTRRWCRSRSACPWWRCRGAGWPRRRGGTAMLPR